MFWDNNYIWTVYSAYGVLHGACEDRDDGETFHYSRHTCTASLRCECDGDVGTLLSKQTEGGKIHKQIDLSKHKKEV